MIPSPDSIPPWRRPQFGFRALAMFSAIVAIVAAIYGGLVRKGTAWPIYIALSCAAPVLLLVIVGGLEWIVRVVDEYRQPRSGPGDEQAGG
jgi:hypothetical protein